MSRTEGASGAGSGHIDLKEAETEFFGITPVSYVDTVVNHINDFLFDCVDIMQTKLVSEGLFTHKEAQESLDRFLNAAQASVDKQFDLFELYVLKNIFVVRPEWNSSGDGDDERGDAAADVSSMKSQIESAIAFHEKMRQEQKELDSLRGLMADVAKFNTEFKKMERQAQLESWPFLAESVAQLMCDAARIAQLVPPAPPLTARQAHPPASSTMQGRSKVSSINIDAAADFEATIK